MNRTYRRWPKGTWMKLISRERLSSFIGPQVGKKMSARTLARYAGVHPSFIDHLTSGRRGSCDTSTAERIAEALGVPLEVLFNAQASTTEHHSVKQAAA